MSEFKMQMQYDPKISLGTIVETVTLLLAAGSAYVALTNADIRHDEAIKANAVEIARIDNERKASVVEVKGDLKDIKDSIKETNKIVTDIRLQQAGIKSR